MSVQSRRVCRGSHCKPMNIEEQVDVVGRRIDSVRQSVVVEERRKFFSKALIEDYSDIEIRSIGRSFVTSQTDTPIVKVETFVVGLCVSIAVSAIFIVWLLFYVCKRSAPRISRSKGKVILKSLQWNQCIDSLNNIHSIACACEALLDADEKCEEEIKKYHNILHWHIDQYIYTIMHEPDVPENFEQLKSIHLIERAKDCLETVSHMLMQRYYTPEYISLRAKESCDKAYGVHSNINDEIEDLIEAIVWGSGLGIIEESKEYNSLKAKLNGLYERRRSSFDKSYQLALNSSLNNSFSSDGDGDYQLAISQSSNIIEINTNQSQFRREDHQQRENDIRSRIERELATRETVVRNIREDERKKYEKLGIKITKLYERSQYNFEKYRNRKNCMKNWDALVFSFVGFLIIILYVYVKFDSAISDLYYRPRDLIKIVLFTFFSPFCENLNDQASLESKEGTIGVTRSIVMLSINKLGSFMPEIAKSVVISIFEGLGMDSSHALCSWRVLVILLPIIVIIEALWFFGSVFFKRFSVLLYAVKVIELAFLADRIVVPMLAPLGSTWPILVLLLVHYLVYFTIDQIDLCVRWSIDQKKELGIIGVRDCCLYWLYSFFVLLVAYHISRNSVYDLYYYGRLYHFI